MKHTRRFFLVLAAGALALAVGRPVGTRPSLDGNTTAPLAGGEGSIESLVDRFLAAVSAGDREALERLRVSESEYRGIIVPGSVEPGAPPQRLGEEASNYFWQDLNAKSVYTRNDLLRRFSGHSLERVDFRFDKGVRRFANHVAHRRLVVVARDERGEEVEIRTGSIVDVDGRFKFVSWIRG